MANKKEIVEYHNKFDHIPKDYEERLAWLYNDIKFTKQDLEKLMACIELLAEAEWEELLYIFYMVPRSTPRARQRKATQTFYVKDAHNKKEVFDQFIAACSDLQCVISTPTRLDCKIYMETPAGMSRLEKMAAELELIHHINAPDWDNLGKGYCDMIQKTLISNDSIVCRGAVEKFYSVLPRIEVTVRFMKSYDCKFNKRSVERRKSFKENPLTIEGIESII